MTQAPETRHDIASFRRELSLLFLINIFLFTGAGAQQQYLSPYLERIGDWSPLSRAFVLATVYGSMMIFRVGNVFLMRRVPQWLWTIVGSCTYLLFTLALLAAAWWPSYWFVLAAAALWGWGGAAFWTGSAMQTLAAARTARRFGTGTGLQYSGGHLGWVLGVFILGHVFQASNAAPYRLYLIAALVTLPGVLLTPLLWRKGLPEPDAPTARQLWGVIRRPKALVSGFLLLTSNLTFGLMISSFADYVATEYGEGFIWITAIFYPIARALCSFASGWLYDRLGPSGVLASGFFGSAAALAWAGTWHSPVSLAVAALAMGFMSAVVPVVASAIVGDSAQRDRWPLAYGVLFTWRDLGVVMAAIAGKLLGVTTGGFDTVFTVFAVVFGVCGVAGMLMRRYATDRL